MRDQNFSTFVVFSFFWQMISLPLSLSPSLSDTHTHDPSLSRTLSLACVSCASERERGYIPGGLLKGKKECRTMQLARQTSDCHKQPKSQSGGKKSSSDNSTKMSTTLGERQFLIQKKVFMPVEH
jgi:hypothetical protein